MKRFKMKVHVHIHVQQVPATDPKKGVTGHVAADENHNDSFYHFATQEIKRTLTAGQLGTARNYRTALNSLHTFCHNRDLGFEHITPRLIGSYEQWLKQKGICLNTISCYMRSLRSLYNKAAEQGLTERQHPFDQVYTGVERTAKRSISLTSLRRLQTLPLAAGTPHSLARDLFLFSLLAYGMPFVDMAFLKKEPNPERLPHLLPSQDRAADSHQAGGSTPEHHRTLPAACRGLPFPHHTFFRTDGSLPSIPHCHRVLQPSAETACPAVRHPREPDLLHQPSLMGKPRL